VVKLQYDNLKSINMDLNYLVSIPAEVSGPLSEEERNQLYDIIDKLLQSDVKLEVDIKDIRKDRGSSSPAQAESCQ
jgi:hypothetical protein